MLDLPIILTIAQKEIRDTLRDRRTLMTMVVMPLVLTPALLVGISKFANYQMQMLQEQSAKIGIGKNISADDPVVTFLKGQNKIEIISVEGNLSNEVKSGKVNIGIENISDNTSMRILFDSTNQTSTAALTKLNVTINIYNTDLTQARLREQNIDPSILSGINIAPSDVTSQKERGGFGLGFLLPLFLVMWAFIGGQYIAIDISAGEKERKTLEALLLTPVSRLTIVLGKFTAVATGAYMSVLMSITSLYIAIKHGGFGNLVANSPGQTSGNMAIDFSLDPTTIAIILTISLLLVILFSSLLLSIGIFAKSFKEAQNYISSGSLIIILPVVVTNLIPNFKPPLWFFAVPVVNAILTFKEALVGTYDLSHIIFTTASLTIVAALALLTTSRIYTREGILLKN